VLAEAFKIGEGEESEAVELSDGGYFFVQVNEVQAPAALAYEDVAEEVAQKWRAEERKTRIAAAVKQAKDAVAAGKKLSDAAALFNRAILEAVLTRGRANDAISQAFSEDIFKADLNAVISGEAGVAGAQTIVEIREIGFGRNRISAGEETAFGQYLGAQLNQEYVDAYLAALREDYGVKVDKERLSELFQQE
jgi:peptidyl-prolyl cis-trans isomerase D